MKADKRVYVTRATYSRFVEIWPATVGIRKFHGCVEYGAAWSEDCGTGQLYEDDIERADWADELTCQKRYGFCPGRGTAWYIDQNGKRTRILLDFSD
ncbi:hypothetical protein LCGC14_2755190 [marine sediment metagenome]|uniref:Uncharacterized protein n=1 Tax=marine sediment metagenome TaxID=412755 RepID=A0A0F8Z0R7_9ZZZZ